MKTKNLFLIVALSFICGYLTSVFGEKTTALNSPSVIDGTWNLENMTYIFDGDSMEIKDSFGDERYAIRKLGNNAVEIKESSPFGGYVYDTLTIVRADADSITLYQNSYDRCLSTFKRTRNVKNFILKWL